MRYLLYAIALSALLAPSARAGDHGGKNHKGHTVCCPACDYVCEFSVEDTKVKKHRYEVECKPICIPPITFPWEKNHGAKGHGKGCDGDCTPGSRCGKVKVVRVMKKVEYECHRCKCKWSAVSINGGKDDKSSDQKVAAEPNILPQSGSTTRAVREVPPPPPISSRRQPALLKPAPVKFDEEPRPDVSRTPKRTYVEIITGFFK